MVYKPLLFIFVFLCSLLEINTQVLPFYGASKYFYISQASLYLSTNPQSFLIPATFPISTAAHRKPFYSIAKVDHFKIHLNQTFHLWTELHSFTSTSFAMTMVSYFITTNNVTVWFGLYPNTYARFRYLLVLNTFPDKFLSLSRIVSAVSYPIAANSFI